ncbi:uncharacterized protein RHO17_018653 isoform 1-T1 [Thomomys bottae]
MLNAAFWKRNPSILSNFCTIYFKMPRIIIRKEAKAVGASLIMVSLIHIALGILWLFLYGLQKEKESQEKDVPMLLLIFYSFISSLFFIIAGSSSIIQGKPTQCMLTFAIVMNIISIIVAITGLIILCIGFISFDSRGSIYLWENLANMMLLQFSVLSTVSVIILSSTIIHWMYAAFPEEETTPSISPSPSITISIYSRH